MKVPIDLFEPEDLELLEQKVGGLQRGKEYVNLTKHDFKVLCNIMEKDTDLPFVEENMDKAMIIRAVGLLLKWHNEAETISDKASLLAATLSLHQLDPSMSRRLISLFST